MKIPPQLKDAAITHIKKQAIAAAPKLLEEELLSQALQYLTDAPASNEVILRLQGEIQELHAEAAVENDPDFYDRMIAAKEGTLESELAAAGILREQTKITVAGIMISVAKTTVGAAATALGGLPAVGIAALLGGMEA